MIVGYARVSTTHQNLESQIEELKRAGAEKIFQEKASGANTNRESLTRMLDYIREGDVVVCTKIDRIARNTKNLLDMVAFMEQKDVAFRVLNLNLDTATPTGKLMMTVLGSVAEFERELQLERQRDGILRAKENGVYKGRQPTAQRKSADVLRMVAEGKKKTTIAKELNIGISSVYRIIDDHKKAQVN